MGCRASKIQNEDCVQRCKTRRRLIRQAVTSRHQFAAAHAAYVHVLKHLGSTFRQFGETEFGESQSTPTTPEAIHPPPPPPIYLPPPSPPHITDLKGTSLSFGSEERTQMLSPPASPNSKQIDYYTENEEDQNPLHIVPSSPPPPSNTNPPPPMPSNEEGTWGVLLNPFRPVEPPIQLQEQRKMRMKEVRVTEVGDDDLPIQEEQIEEKDSQLEKEKDAQEQSVSETYGAVEETEGEDEGSSNINGDAASDNGNYKAEAKSDGNKLAIIVAPKIVGQKELVDVLRDVDDCFMRAYDSGRSVARMLEAIKVPYHSNFVDPKAYDSHSKRVLQAISWFKAPSSPSHELVSDDCGLTGSHASTLDRLCAWEKKLYEEVKALEAVRLEYRRRCRSLMKKDAKGDVDSIDRTKALVKALESRILVCVEAIESTVMTIQKLRDEELFSQLVELLDGLMHMWANLYECHKNQHKIVLEMKAFAHMAMVEPTSNVHRTATTQLHAALEAWYHAFDKVISTQRDYLYNLNGWLRLSVMPLGLELKGRLGEPTKVVLPRICELTQEWTQALNRLPDRVALEAIKSFAAVVQKISELQTTELRQRKKADSMTRELERKYAHLKLYEKKHPEPEHYVVPEEKQNLITAIVPFRSPLTEKRIALDSFKMKVNEEKDKASKSTFDTRAMTLASFHTGMPSVFQAVYGFSRIYLQSYQSLFCKLQNGRYLLITEK